jgi:putative CocE/NonD family hydrolase
VVSWTHDPANPVPSTATQDGVWTFLENYPDEGDLADRPDVLTFTTDVVNHPLDVAGPINAFLAVGSSAPSMHLFVKLLDVDPSGAAYPISRGQIVVHAPDAEQPVEVDLMEIAYRVRQGHRLRVQIASSDYPWFLVHPGSDDNPWFARKMITNKQLVVVGGTSPSHVDITVLPPNQT